jgi:hypothetical protein
MKTLRGRHYSLKQQTQFTMVNKLIDPLSSDINDGLNKSYSASSFHLNGAILQKRDVPHP